MIWNELNYTKKGAFIGGFVGILGVILFLIMSISDFGIFEIMVLPFLVLSILFASFGVFGCKFEMYQPNNGGCYPEVTLGLVFTI